MAESSDSQNVSKYPVAIKVLRFPVGSTNIEKVTNNFK